MESSYWERYWPRLRESLGKATGEQVIGAILALGIVVLQIHYHLYTRVQENGAYWSITWPYLCLLVVLTAWHFVKVAVDMDREHCANIGELQANLLAADRKLDEAINKDRPDVFATLSFGPGHLASDTGSVKLLNLGPKDAFNVQIAPIAIEGEKKITFPPLSRIQSGFDDYPMYGINGYLDVTDVSNKLAMFLSHWCASWRINELSIDLVVEWFDASGNKFRSVCLAKYERDKGKCRTVIGVVERVRPLA